MFIKVAKTLLLILWMGLIFYLSHQPYDLFSETTNAQQIAAHIFLYGVLAYLLITAIVSWGGEWRLKNILLFSLFFSIFYGITDEYHQGFIPGRYVSFIDLSFDAVGAFSGAFLYKFVQFRKKPKLLLHICCVGCGVYISDTLKKDYNVILYFYNPNIFPEDEYVKRLEETKKIAKKYNLKLIIGKYGHNEWLKLVKGYEGETERGKRCALCYRERLKNTAKTAEEKGYDHFTTTLTISPHKDTIAISDIGNELQEKHSVKFLDRDFKKQDGFKKACELSRELGLYRQNYCGCEFSRTNMK